MSNLSCKGWLLNIASYKISETRMRKYLQIIVLILVTAFLVQISFMNKYYDEIGLKRSISGKAFDILRTKVEDSYSYKELHSTYENRIDHIKDICKIKRLQKPTNITFNEHTFCDLHGFNISLCKVPKCGSTYWVKVINVLKSGVSNIDLILRTDRRKTHRRGNNTCRDRLKTLSVKGTKILLMSRDPYARIYSAYVDKSYLAFNTNNKTLYKTNNCSAVKQPYIRTFQEFIEGVLDNLKDESSNPHWTPISTLCNPCQSNVFLQIKLEEMSKDMGYIFSRIGFSDELQPHIRKLSTSKFATLAGIASTVFHKQLKNKCRTSYLIAERLWISFQLQGHIRSTSKFPGHLFYLTNTNNTKIATDLLMKIVSNEITLNPLTKLEANAQRHANLVREYKHVLPETLLKIQQQFKMDFLLFNYSMSLPK